MVIHIKTIITNFKLITLLIIHLFNYFNQSVPNINKIYITKTDFI